MRIASAYDWPAGDGDVLVLVRKFSPQLIDVRRSCFVVDKLTWWKVLGFYLDFVTICPFELESSASVYHRLGEQVIVSAVAKRLHFCLHSWFLKDVCDCWSFPVVFREERANHVAQLFRVL